MKSFLRIQPERSLDMLRKRLPACIGAVVMGVLGAANAHAAAVTFADLLEQMTDMTMLTRMPDPSYTTGQFSSYDRDSTDPDALTDENWFANHDRGNFLRTEERNGKTEYVMMDTDTPGAIVRFWSANPTDAGTVRIYLDGAEDPAVEMPLSKLLGGEAAIAPPPLAGTRGKGWNLYLPLPYAKSCKVTASKNDFYYIINYRSYEAGTEVETFSMDLAAEHSETIASVADALRTPDGIRTLPPGQEQENQGFAVTVGEGAAELLRIEGPAAIYALLGKLEAEDREKALRTCLLEITFDGQDRPAVQAPVGGFFGSAPGLNPYQSLPMGMLDSGGLYSKWVMPFQESAALRLVNHSGMEVTFEGLAVTSDYDWNVDALYFHAKWRAEHDIPTRPRQDWNFITAQGRGRYVGNMLNITNPVTAWWGEGDEKIYIDGEDFPSHFGTGTEDYYGYAWGSTELYEHAYHNQTRVDGPGRFGHTSVNRWHIMDNIPFTESFRLDIEVWHWKDVEIHQAATVYWYGRPANQANFTAPEPELLTVPEFEAPAVKQVKGALEGEKLERLEHTGGELTVQTSTDWAWSGGAQLWWMDAEPGEALELGFPVEEAGTYDLRAAFTKAHDYGIMDFYVNGEKVEGPYDFYNDGVVVTPETSLGVFELKRGQNVFKVQITGVNPDAAPRYMFGLDYLRLKPA